jgi:hypothetical protein
MRSTGTEHTLFHFPASCHNMLHTLSNTSGNHTLHGILHCFLHCILHDDHDFLAHRLSKVAYIEIPPSSH